MKKILFVLTIVVVSMAFTTKDAQAQEAFVGEIKLFAGNFAPRGWAFCHGQVLPISSNEALFSLIGTTYGGNGVQTFNLPDLRGATALGAGTRPGSSELRQGAVVNLSGNSSELKGVGLNYIICLQGIYPSRN